MKEQAGSSAVVQGVARDKYAIGYSGIGYKTADVRAVALSAHSGAQAEFIAAEPDNAYTGEYPLARFLYLTVNYKPGSQLDPLRREFIKYVFSRDGQMNVVKDGYFPVTAAIAREDLESGRHQGRLLAGRPRVRLREGRSARAGRPRHAQAADGKADRWIADDRQLRHVFTGRKRARTPKRSVLLADRVARWVIALGGIGSIVAVSLVGLFLFYVVMPLFLPSSVEEQASVRADDAPARVVHVGLNEYGTMAWSLHRDGSLLVRRLSDGQIVRQFQVPESTGLTCWSFGIDDDRCAFGYADGSVRNGTLGFETEFIEPDAARRPLLAWRWGEPTPYADGVVERTPEDQFRYQYLTLDLGDPLQLAPTAIAQIDQALANRGVVFAALDAAGSVHVRQVRERRNLLTGKTTRTLTGESIDLAADGLLGPRAACAHASAAHRPGRQRPARLA